MSVCPSLCVHIGGCVGVSMKVCMCSVFMCLYSCVFLSGHLCLCTSLHPHSPTTTPFLRQSLTEPRQPLNSPCGGKDDVGSLSSQLPAPILNHIYLCVRCCKGRSEDSLWVSVLSCGSTALLSCPQVGGTCLYLLSHVAACSTFFFFLRLILFRPSNLEQSCGNQRK